MTKCTSAAATILVLALAACAAGTDDAATDTTTASGSLEMPTAMLLGETTGMSTPESVLHDSELDVYFVSNIVGNPSQKDNSAFIARVHPDSTAVMTKLVEGGVAGVTLNAPKGMTVVGDTLWVADIDVLRGFNRRTGAVVANVDFAPHQATFLNDVAAGADGSIYITDSGIHFDATGTMTHPGIDRVFRVNGRTVSEVASGAALSSPNGLLWDNTASRWIVAPFAALDLLALGDSGAAPTIVASGPGGYDGLQQLGDGRLLVSSWTDSSVYIVSNAIMTRLIAGVAAPADFALDTRRNILAVPRFNDGKVEYFSLR